MLADLHAHTTCSDGSDSPTQLVAEAAAAGLEVLALTDHDSTAGWAEAEVAAHRHGIVLIPGIEVSTQAGGTSVHMLGYLHDPTYEPLLAELAASRHSRTHRAEAIVAALAQDVDISYDQVLAQVEPGATVGRPHIADALVAGGVVRNRDEAFARFLYDGSPYYRRYHCPDSVAAVRLIRAAGGIPVMAHPFAASRGRIVGDEVIEELAAAGLFALEAHHPDHDADQVAHTLDLAKALGLQVTGSSDYHGTGKQARLADRTTPAGVVEALLAQPTATPVVRP